MPGMNPAYVGLKHRDIDNEDSESSGLSDYQMPQDRMEIDTTAQRSNDGVDSDDDDSLCEIICTVPAPKPTSVAAIASSTSPQQRPGASVELRLKRDEQNGRQESGSTSAAVASPPALTASASMTTFPPSQRPGVSVALRLKRDTQNGHQDSGRTSTAAAAAASPVTSHTAIKSQPRSADAGTQSSARKRPPTSVALKCSKRTTSSLPSPRRQNSKTTETSADIQQKPSPSNTEVDFAGIDAMLSSFALDRNIERQRLIRKAIFGSNKTKVRESIARGPVTHVVVSHCDKTPLVAHEMHVSHINSSSKALGRAKKEDAVVNTKIDDQAEELKMPLMVYREKLEDLEKVLAALPMHQRFDVRVHKYLQGKLGPVDIPEQFTDISLTQLQEDMKQLHTEDDHDEAAMTYEVATDSYRTLFCMQCATFDCNFHILENRIKPATCKNQAMEAAIAIAYEKERRKKPTPANDPLAFLPMPSSSIPFSVQPEYTLETQPTLRAQFSLSRLKLIHEVSGGTTESLQASFGGRHSKQLLDNLPPTPVATVNKNLLKKPTTRKMPKGVEQRIQKDAVEKTFYFPCSHEGQCTEKNKDCSCVQNHQLCTERCIWGKYSANLFRGCECASGCRSEFKNGERVLKSLKCSCALAAVECDPSICQCKCCQNQNMTHRRSKQFFLAPSTVPGAGWGLFTKYPIAKDDFVGEYVGHFEKDDVNVKNRYFFDVCREYVLDSEKEGNPTRYINHSDKSPNLKQMSIGVSGERRIGFFALRKIPAQAELFFDYGKEYWNQVKAQQKEEKKLQGS